MNNKNFHQKMNQLKDELDTICIGLSFNFSRVDAAETAADYIYGLLSRVDRKNSWQTAETVGHHNPYRFQHLLGRSLWNEDEVRDQHVLRVQEEFGQDGILSMDESGFLKKGDKSAGVKRQYSGTAGKIENCQIGVFLNWKTDRGQVLLDRELYIPNDWIEDRQRCRNAGIPDDRTFKTKPELAREMIKRILNLGVLPKWVAGDEVYGKDSNIRFDLEERKIPYALCVPSNQSVAIDFEKQNVSYFLKILPSNAWKRLNCGIGSKGARLYDWAVHEINHPYGDEYQRWILFRRSLSNPQDIAYYLVFGPSQTSLQEIVNAVGSRWSIEECFESSKGEVGLDEYEVRSYKGWYRHITLAMIAHSVLSISCGKLFSIQNETSSFTDFKKKRNL